MKAETIAVGTGLAAARSRLAATSEHPGLDAQTLLAGLSGKTRAWLLAHPEVELDPVAAARLEAALRRLDEGTPVPYILGEWEFYGLLFAVTPDVLIPRPETELLVEAGLEWLHAHPSSRKGADLGTGSGCIAVSLAAAVPDLQLVATDISPEALRVAKRNTGRHGVEERVRLEQADLLSGISGPFDLICSNPPYIPSETLRKLEVYAHEPALALDGGSDGLDCIRRLLHQSAEKLAGGGLVLVEIEAGQGAQAAALARGNFPGGRISLLKDLAGLDRVLRIEGDSGR